ncbi:MAG: mechanosensitive ion channel [Monoglobaceae bacterium]
MNWLTNFLTPLISGLSNVIQALLLLIVACIAAVIAKKITVKIFSKVFNKKIKESNNTEFKDTPETIGKIIYAIVFCLFLPGALDKLGMTNVSAPIASMAAKFLNFLPNILAAIILVVFGNFLAKLIRQLLSSLLKKTKIDKAQEKVGIDIKEGTKLSDIIAKIAYAFVVIIFVISGIQVLGINAISEPATNMVNQIFGFIPYLFAAIILMIFGIFFANLVSKLLESILAGTGMDEKVHKALPERENHKYTAASKVIATVVKIVIDIIFIVSAVKILNIEVLTSVGTAVIAYLPQVVAALAVLIIAWFVCGWVEKLILKGNAEAKHVAFASKLGIMTLAIFMALSQLGIAPKIVNTLFIVFVSAIGIAVAIAFGIGGKDYAKKLLEKIDNKSNK